MTEPDDRPEPRPNRPRPALYEHGIRGTASPITRTLVWGRRAKRRSEPEPEIGSSEESDRA